MCWLFFCSWQDVGGRRDDGSEGKQEKAAVDSNQGIAQQNTGFCDIIL